MPDTRLDAWRKNALSIAERSKQAVAKTSSDLKDTAKVRLGTTATLIAESYNSALTWQNNSELSQWLTEHLSNQVATIGSKAMDAEYLRTSVGGSWHRIYDGGHSLTGSWTAVSEAFPDLDALEKVGTWANEYWKDFITTRGMPIVTLDYNDDVSEYFKHFDCVNLAELVGANLTGVSIYCNWNDPEKLVASAASAQCSGLAYGNVVAPLVSLIGIGRACFLLNQSEQGDLRNLIEPALKGLTRSGATVLLITVVPGGFLVHLSCGIVVCLAHNYVWDKSTENKEAIFFALKECLNKASTALPGQINIRRSDEASQPALMAPTAKSTAAS